MSRALRSARVGSKRAGSTRRRLTRGAAITGLAALATAGVSAPSAGAATTAVTNVTVTVGSPSSAAGALTSYEIGFETSPTGALSDSDSITVALPSGTDLSKFGFSGVFAGTTPVGHCETSAETAVTCSLDGGSSIPASHAVTLMLNGVRNPTAVASYSLSVNTTQDPTTVDSPAYTITAPQPVGNVQVTMNAPSDGASAATTYTIKFKTSPTGGLSDTTPSTVRIAFPTGTDLSSLYTARVTAGGSCGATTDLVVTCVMVDGSIAGGRSATVTLNGVRNPPTAGSYTLTVTTSSDTTAALSAGYTVAAGHRLRGLNVSIDPPSSAAGALTTYAINFTTSATGGLAGNTASRITITLPPRTRTSAFFDGTVAVGATHLGYCTRGRPRIATCFLDNGATIGNQQTVTVTLNGVTNPRARNAYSLTVSTSSDLTAVTSPAYAVTAAAGVRAARLTLSHTSAGATNVTYRTRFETATGLAGNTGSTITENFPAGTDLSALTGSSVLDGTTEVGTCSHSVSLTVTCLLFNGSVVNAGDTVVVKLTGVNNPATANASSLNLSTSSDTIVRSVKFTIT